MIKKSWLMLLVMMLLITFSALAEPLKAGSWRFELKTDNATVPFLAEFKFHKKKLTGKILNGKETIPLENIVYDQKKLSIPLQTYEITLELNQESPTKLTGLWIRHNKHPEVKLPIEGVHGETQRFLVKKEDPLPQTLQLLEKYYYNKQILADTGNNSYETVLNEFDINNVSSQYDDLLNNA